MKISEPFLTNVERAPRRSLRDDRGESIRLVDPENGPAQHVDIHVNVLRPDSGPGPRHYHQQAENIYLVLEGAIEVEIEEKVFRLEADDVLFIPPGVTHATSNRETHSARFIEIYAPAGSDFHIVESPGGD